MQSAQSPNAQPTVEAIWLSPGDALALTESATGDRSAAIDTLIGRLKTGLVRASYETFAWEGSGGKSVTLSANFIDAKWWNHYRFSDNSTLVWISGDLRLRLGNYFSDYYSTDVVLTFFSVKIERKGIDEIVANATPKPRPQKTPVKATERVNPGGAPRKEWWDDFWIAICGQIYEGKLLPKTQAELERAMLDWVGNQPGADVGETTIKAASRKLFKAWKLGVKN
jgi:hypothetical protein